MAPVLNKDAGPHKDNHYMLCCSTEKMKAKLKRNLKQSVKCIFALYWLSLGLCNTACFSSLTGCKLS